ALRGFRVVAPALRTGDLPALADATVVGLGRWRIAGVPGAPAPARPGVRRIDRGRASPCRAAAGRSRMIWFWAIAGLMPLAALAVYFIVGAPSAIEQTGMASAAHSEGGARDPAALAAAADQLKTRLLREPDHVEGWILLGRALTSLRRFAEARDAYRQ